MNKPQKSRHFLRDQQYLMFSVLQGKQVHCFTLLISWHSKLSHLSLKSKSNSNKAILAKALGWPPNLPLNASWLFDWLEFSGTLSMKHKCENKPLSYQWNLYMDHTRCRQLNSTLFHSIVIFYTQIPSLKPPLPFTKHWISVHYKVWGTGFLGSGSS